MDNLEKYLDNLDYAYKKIKNNSNYFKSFGDVYVAKKFKEYLDNMCSEMNKVKKAAKELKELDK